METGGRFSCLLFLDRLVAKTQNGTEAVRVYYNNKGQTARIEDISAGNTEEYVFDLVGRLIQSHTYGNRRELVKYKYDTLNRLKQTDSYVDNALIENVYNYGSDSLLSNMYQGILYFTYTYDHLNRMTVENIRLHNGNTAKNEYTYINGTALVATKKFYINDTLTETLAYTYDKSGNIETITQNGTLYESYTYDELNQLKTVTKGTEVYEYTYDNGGNILSVKLNGTVVNTYTYGDANWKDKLTAYNGQTITYDAIGNPIQYRDGLRFDWVNGRTLSGIEINGGDAYITMLTNADGIRFNKDVMWFSGNYDYVNYSFEYNGTTLIRQYWNNNTMWFLYDESGNSVGFTLNGTEYYYIKNLQGDITAIADASGTIVAKYTYDVWGKILSITDADGNDVSANSSHIANINPLRYRGYYYDSETGLYYLISRYYDPETGRFVNADGYVSTGQGLNGNNMFAYCGNNPVTRADQSGEGWFSIFIVTVAIVTVAKNLCIANKNYKTNSQLDANAETTTKDELINDQYGDTGKTFEYGVHPASWNACETIAVHNAKVLTGRESTLSETMYDFQMSGAMPLGGVLGSNPYQIGSVLKKSDIDYTKVGLGDMMNPGTYIISYWNGPFPAPIHTVAISYDGSTYTTYNLSGKGEVSTENPASYATRFICGYYLG